MINEQKLERVCKERICLRLFSSNISAYMGKILEVFTAEVFWLMESRRGHWRGSKYFLLKGWQTHLSGLTQKNAVGILSWHVLKGLERSTKYLVGSSISGLGVNQGHPECDEGALPTGSWYQIIGSRVHLVMMWFVGRVTFWARELLPFMWTESMTLALSTFGIYGCIEHLDSNVKLKKYGGDVQGQLWAKRMACTSISEGQINIWGLDLPALYRVGPAVACPLSFWNSFNLNVVWNQTPSWSVWKLKR